MIFKRSRSYVASSIYSHYLTQLSVPLPQPTATLRLAFVHARSLSLFLSLSLSLSLCVCVCLCLALTFTEAAAFSVGGATCGMVILVVEAAAGHCTRKRIR